MMASRLVRSLTKSCLGHAKRPILSMVDCRSKDLAFGRLCCRLSKTYWHRKSSQGCLLIFLSLTVDTGRFGLVFVSGVSPTLSSAGEGHAKLPPLRDCSEMPSVQQHNFGPLYIAAYNVYFSLLDIFAHI